MTVLRTICYRALCERCGETVSPAPRMTEREASADLAAHMEIQHDTKPGGSENG